MSRKDVPLFIALIALLIAWPHIDRHLIRPLFPAQPEPAPVTEYDPVERPDPEGKEPVRLAPAAEPDVEEPDPEEIRPEERVTLQNEEVEFILSSHGAAVVSVRLLDYPQTRKADSDPVVLGFSGQQALAYETFPGLGTGVAFDVESAPGRVVFRRETADGLRLTRTYTLGSSGYALQLEDAFENLAEDEQIVPAHRLTSGPMRALPGETAMRGVTSLGIDTLTPDGVLHWGRNRWGRPGIPSLFSDAQEALDKDRPPVRVEGLPSSLDDPVATEWAAVKNKYFVQILRPEFGAESLRMQARREVTEQERQDPGARVRVEIEEVSLALLFGHFALAPGETHVRSVEYYAGPKKLAELSKLGHHQVGIMEFGFWSPVSRVLLRALNLFYRAIPNYGVAIMLLTILIRILFWPITHKSTQSMRRMQEVQPLIQALREKHKDNPQKLQRETMALYKEHKINPLGGCLPMVIQIPVFIALFVVLRSAIELRFAPFLWVRDLSEPENLLAGQLPFGLSLNILPLFMTAVTFAQQKLTPAAGDPSQQKMMAMMPLIMLIFFYNFAAGLVLYWTTNQLLMVVQQLLHRRRKKAA